RGRPRTRNRGLIHESCQPHPAGTSGGAAPRGLPLDLPRAAAAALDRPRRRCGGRRRARSTFRELDGRIQARRDHTARRAAREARLRAAADLGRRLGVAALGRHEPDAAARELGRVPRHALSRRPRERLAAQPVGAGADGGRGAHADHPGFDDGSHELGDLHRLHVLAAGRGADDAPPRPRAVAAGRDPRVEHEDGDQQPQGLPVHARRQLQPAAAGGDMKREITPRTIAFVLIGVAVVLGAAGWFMMVSPKRSEATKLAATIETKQSQVSTQMHQASSAAQPAATESIGTALPDVPLMPDVVDQLNTLASRSDVALDTITPQAAVPGTGYEAIPLTVVVDGRYFAVEKFLRLVREQVQLDKTQL